MNRYLANLRCLLFALPLFAGNAYAFNLSLDVVFTDANYQVSATDTFADLLAAHNSANVISTTNVNALDNVDTSVYAGNISGNYGVLMSASLHIEDAGNYEFRVGTDWGRGGGVALFDSATNALISETIDSTNIWWANNWNHGDVIYSSYNFAANTEYTIMWIGFEDCCAGSSTIQFSYEGSPFQLANVANLTPHVVPIPPAFLLMAPVALGLLSRQRVVAAKVAPAAET
ncbi:MAG: hypothetical protein AAF387_14025 [Pseudomonadota bacterium]